MYLLGIYLTTPTYPTNFLQSLPNTLQTLKHPTIPLSWLSPQWYNYQFAHLYSNLLHLLL